MTEIRKAITKMFQKAIVNTLETNGKIKLKNITTKMKKNLRMSLLLLFLT